MPIQQDGFEAARFRQQAAGARFWLKVHASTGSAHLPVRWKLRVRLCRTAPRVMGYLSRAYRLAFFLHRDKAVALEVAAAALMRLERATARQGKRHYYRPKIGRYRLALAPEPLLQHMVCQESKYWERRRAADAASENQGLRWFLAHLVRQTLCRNAFYVAVAICRLLYGYGTRETLVIYDTLAQSDECRYQESAVRVAKKRLLESLSDHFAPLIELRCGPRGEHLLKSHAPTHRESKLVRRTLCELTPWNTECRMPEHFDPCRDPVAAFSSKTDPDGCPRAEIRRIHALLHPPCFERIVRALGFEAPEHRLRVPDFTDDHPTDSAPSQRYEFDSESITVPNSLALYDGD